MQMEMIRKWGGGLSIFISDKINLKMKAIKKKKRKALYNEKGTKTRRGYYTH